MPSDSETMPGSDISSSPTSNHGNEKPKKLKPLKQLQCPKLIKNLKSTRKTTPKTIGQALREENYASEGNYHHRDPPLRSASLPTERRPVEQSAKRKRTEREDELSSSDESYPDDYYDPRQNYTNKRVKQSANLLPEDTMRSLVSSVTANVMKACLQGPYSQLPGTSKQEHRRPRHPEPYPRAGESSRLPPTSQGQYPPQATGITICGTLVPEKIREKIIDGKYVDLRSLLPLRSKKKSAKSNRTDDSEGDNLDDEDSDKNELTQFQWLECFLDYVTIYTSEYPSATESILSYMKFILKLMDSGKDWRSYDIMFRKAREAKPYLWTDILLDSRFDISDKKQGKATTSSNHQQFFREGSRGEVAKGYCFDFHKRNSRCENRACPYSHRCQICNGAHPVFRHRDSINFQGRNNYPDQRFFSPQNYPDSRFFHDNRNFGFQSYPDSRFSGYQRPRGRSPSGSSKRSADSNQFPQTSRNAKRLQ